MKPNRIPIALHQAVMSCLRAKLRQAGDYFNTTFPEPLLNYQQRGTSAGTAWLDKWEIRLNPVLLLANQDSFIDEVIPHELAHLLVFRQFGRVAPHGSEWRWMMASVLHTEPRRTHGFDLATVRTNTYRYQCGCQRHELTVRRHNRIVRGESVYRCRQCGAVLRFAGDNDAENVME
ncbi:SprT family zinc-dependent metalloprotease [Sodalis sp. C49]|uniref:SprT family zinc-dependent metalloprotease n=1 Tax=unclassified Sodalis (in: enterobacteria) TaxID=2636512 RepID=UPI003965B424